MLNLTIDEIIEKIEKEETFNAIINDNSFFIAIEEYMPYACLAIHNGGNFREELRDKIALSKMDRWLEEDSHTWLFIASLPIRIIVYDSRYEYDLNRNENSCIYDEAWGKQVWKESLSDEEKNKSLQKYKNFYKVVHALVKKLEEKFNAAIIYDIHSYNYKRYEKKDLPVFNVGTVNLPNKFQKYINYYLKELKTIDIFPIENISRENDIFFGKGYLLEYIIKNFENTIVFATEIKKIYVDESSGDEYPEIIDKIRVGLKRAFLNTSFHYIKSFSKSKIKNKYNLLASMTENNLKIVDEAFFNLVKKIEILQFVNPINLATEKNKFFANKFRKNPSFKYKPLDFDVNEMKKSLYKLPISKIKDITIKNLYEDMLNLYINKIDLLSLRDKEEFLYLSLKHYGKPSKVDIENAKYLLYIAKDEIEEELLDSIQTKEVLEKEIKKYGFKCSVKIVKNLSANAMVLNSVKIVQLRKDAYFTKTYAKALAHHEVGVHMLTTFNAIKQPLKLLRLGLVQNTSSQEGLAILSEYLSGFLTIDRLKEIAVRVIAVDLMVKGYEFKELFIVLKDEYHIEEDRAFQVTTRVFRSGGFTKDYVYLKGFIEVLKFYKSGANMDTLFIGKTSLKYRHILNELIQRNILKKPTYKPFSFENSCEKDEIINFVLKALK